MADIELTDPEPARRYLAQGLCLTRAASHKPAAVRQSLQWILEVAAGGAPLPAPALIADLGVIAIGLDRDTRRNDPPVLAPVAGLLRTYEDHVLGRLDSDATIARAADVLRKLKGRDQSRGVAFVVEQFRQRANAPGVFVSPSVVKSLAELAPDEAVRMGWDSLSNVGLEPSLKEATESLVRAARLAPAALSPQDLFELERGSAVANLGQRVASRALLGAADEFISAQPAHPPRVRPTRREIPTHALDEDRFPVGGFAAVSNRGGIESLLHSQLAYMEVDDDDRPDLFDVKYLRDELLYYSRDENQFLRRRRGFTVMLVGDLSHARFKDPELPCQRILLGLAGVVAIVRLLARWLSHDALHFRIVAANPLAAERELMQLVLWEEIERGIVDVAADAPPDDAARQRLVLAWQATRQNKGDLEWVLGGDVPGVQVSGTEQTRTHGHDPMDSWHSAVAGVITEWMS